MKRVLITGANGYIGSHVVKTLCDYGVDVVAVTDDGGTSVDCRAKILRNRIFKQNGSLYREAGSPSVCIHLAWRDEFAPDSDTHMSQLSDHYAFLKQLVEDGLEQLVVLGTVQEIGNYSGAVDENTPCNPMSMYGLAKDSLRKSLFSLAKKKGICLQWLRAFELFEDDPRTRSVFSEIARANADGEKAFSLHDGKLQCDFEGIDLLAKQIALTALQQEFRGIINCCSGAPVSLADKVAEYICSHRYSIRVKDCASPDDSSVLPAIWGDTKKINAILEKAGDPAGKAVNSRTTIVVQAVIYNNDIPSLLSTVASVANAARVARELDGLSLSVTLFYGDASPEPIFSEADIARLNEQYSGDLKVDYIFWNSNTGSALGQNKISKLCTSDYIVIMNPDVKLSPHYFYYHLIPFEDKTVGMVEARQTPIEHSKEYNRETLETTWSSGACTMVRRPIFQQVGGFDSDSFFLYCDDVDLSWRVRLAGYRLIYQPVAPVFHGKGLSADAKWQPSSAEQYFSAFAAIMMAYKWSNHSRVECLCKQFSASPLEFEQKAANDFLQKKSEGKLPKQLDPDGKIASFPGDYYSAHRFYL